jgi:hypothetical protein
LANADAVRLVDAERDAHDRGVLGTDDHGADDQDLGVGQYPDDSDQAGDRQQCEPAGRVPASRADPRFRLLPYRSEVERTRLATFSASRLIGDFGVDVFDDDRPAPVDLELPKLLEHPVRLRRDEVELNRVAVRIASRAFEHDQVEDTGIGLQRLDQRFRDVPGAHRANVNHRNTFAPYAPEEPPRLICVLD